MTWRRYSSTTCFVCGRDNPTSLRAAVVASGGQAHILAEVPLRYAGMPGVLHGGVVACLLDEAMWYAIYSADGHITVTAGLELRFLRPAPPLVPLLVAAAVQPEAGGSRALSAVARLLDPQGRLLASGRGRFIPVGLLEEIHRFLRVEPAEADLVARIEQWPGR